MAYKLLYDYHTHTTFSHGKGSIEDNVKAAIAAGLKGVAIADHGAGHLSYGIDRDAPPKMRAEVERLKEAYPQIEIYLSVEANIVNSENGLDMTAEEMEIYDFIIAGYHYRTRNSYMVENWLHSHLNLPVKVTDDEGDLLHRNTRMVEHALKNSPIKILTHPGEKGPVDIVRIAKLCVEKGILMEINARHAHLTTEEIKIAADLGATFIIGSDAHTPERVGDCRAALARLEASGVDPKRVVNLVEV